MYAEPNWANWRARMQAARAAKRWTYVQLAEALDIPGVNHENLVKWLNGPIRCPLHLLNPIANALDVDEVVALADLGMVSENVARLALEATKLRQVNAKLRSQLQRMPESGLILRTLQDCLNSGVTVTVIPANEGVTYGSLHVADRIIFQPPKGGQIPLRIGEALVLGGGFNPASFALAEMFGNHLPVDGREYEAWTLPRLTASRPAPDSVLPRLGRNSAILVLSLTIAPSPGDVGSLLAYALRMGFNTTRDLRTHMYGGRPEEGLKTWQRQLALHALLSDSDAGEHLRGMVWSHFGISVRNADAGLRQLTNALSAVDPQLDLRVIWLRETDDLLEEYLGRSAREHSLDSLSTMRGMLDRILPESCNVSIVDVGTAVSVGHRRDSVMDRSLLVTRDILFALIADDISDLTEQLSREEMTPKALVRCIVDA